MKNSFFSLIEKLVRSSIEPSELIDTEKEHFEITKGKYKTQVDMFFTKEGFPVGYSYQCETLPTPEQDKANQLELEKKEAVEKEDYELAAQLYKQLQDLRVETK